MTTITSPTAVTTIPPSAGEVKSRLTPAFRDELIAKIEAQRRESHIPGTVVLIRIGEPNTPQYEEFFHTFGFRTWDYGGYWGDRPTPEAISQADHWRIGSNTKLLTGTLIFKLVEEKKVALSDPISKHLSGNRLPPVAQYPNIEAITVAHLLNMRSGIYNYSLNASFNAKLDENPGRVWSVDDLLNEAWNPDRPEEKKLAIFNQFNYSNTNTLLLGQIIDKYYGNIAAAFQEHIFNPLEMKNSVYKYAEFPAPHPQGYMFGTNMSTLLTSNLPDTDKAKIKSGAMVGNNWTGMNVSWGATAGCVIASAQDLAVYGRDLVRDTSKILSPATQKLRRESLQPKDPGNPSDGAYGLGIGQMGPFLGHIGEIGGFNSFVGHNLDRDITLVVNTNLMYDVNGKQAATEIARKIAEKLLAPSTNKVPPNTTPATTLQH